MEQSIVIVLPMLDKIVPFSNVERIKTLDLGLTHCNRTPCFFGPLIIVLHLVVLPCDGVHSLYLTPEHPLMIQLRLLDITHIVVLLAEVVVAAYLCCGVVELPCEGHLQFEVVYGDLM